jgi:hypothetical protein
LSPTMARRHRAGAIRIGREALTPALAWEEDRLAPDASDRRTSAPSGKLPWCVCAGMSRRTTRHRSRTSPPHCMIARKVVYAARATSRPRLWAMYLRTSSADARRASTASVARAAAVKPRLVDLLNRCGKGLVPKRFDAAATAVAPNDTPEGRGDNRRVELVKM